MWKNHSKYVTNHLRKHIFLSFFSWLFLVLFFRWKFESYFKSFWKKTWKKSWKMYCLWSKVFNFQKVSLCLLIFLSFFGYWNFYFYQTHFSNFDIQRTVWIFKQKQKSSEQTLTKWNLQRRRWDWSLNTKKNFYQRYMKNLASFVV